MCVLQLLISSLLPCIIPSTVVGHHVMLATTKQSGSAVGTQPLIQEILAVCLGDLALLVVTLGSGSGPPTQKLWTQTAVPATTLSLHSFTIVALVMGCITSFHFTIRLFLLILYRLRSVRLARVELAVVCCHVVLLRVILTSSQQPPGRHRRAIVICVRNSLVFKAFMKALTVARCATVNEILRRRRQAVCDNAIHTRTVRRFALCSIAFEHTALEEPHPDKSHRQPKNCVTLPSFDTSEKASDTEAIVVQIAVPETANTTIMHRRRSSVWKPVLDRDCTNSAVLVALQLNAERCNLEMPKDLTPISTSAKAEEDSWKKQFGANAPFHEALNPRAQDISSLRFRPLQGPIALDTFLPETCVENLSESASPTSDTTLFDEPVVCPGLSKDVEMSQAYTAFDNTARRRLISAGDQQSRVHSTSPLRAHHRPVSSDSAFDAIGAPPVPLRSRVKTNDGLLSFKANPSRDSARNDHRRRVSLKLPVKPQTSELGTLHRINQPDVGTHNMSQHQLGTAVDRETLTPEERDLEYKHRHTFIGTGSLDDFLELLETSSARVATQSATARAFVQLASAEQLYARQCSRRPGGWELVSRTTLDVMDVTSVDYVVQLQVKLGSITLRQFLDMIPFDENSEVAATRVIEAFSAASHIDAKANMDKKNKARAFRSWIVSQKEEPGL